MEYVKSVLPAFDCEDGNRWCENCERTIMNGDEIMIDMSGEKMPLCSDCFHFASD